MNGIFLQAEGKPPAFRTDLPDPKIRSGGVVLRMLSVPVLSYTRDVLSGSLGYLMPTPFVPGNSGVGVIEQVGDDVVQLKVGQRVSIDPRLAPHSAAETPEANSILIGLTASTPVSQKLQQVWKDGSYAEKALVPAECVTPLDALSQLPPERLSLLSHLAIPYGGLLRGELRASQTVVINGATGAFGARAVLVALALGAGRVVAVGRDQTTLDALIALDPKRVVAAALQKGDIAKNAAAILAAAGGVGADLYFDMLGRAQEPDSILACLQSLRHRGTAVFMGGVRIPIPIDYAKIMISELTIRGNFMYPRTAVADLVRLVATGQLDLNKIALRTFPLDQFEAACDQAERAKALDAVSVVMG